MGSIGRPATRPAKLMDGFYIEVRNRGSNAKGIRIRCETKQAMDVAAADYSKNKEVIVLGEYKDDTWLSEVSANSKPKKSSKAKVRS